LAVPVTGFTLNVHECGKKQLHAKDLLIMPSMLRERMHLSQGLLVTKPMISKRLTVLTDT